MIKNASRQDSFKFIKKAQLQKLKVKAIRTGIWHKALQRIDRVLSNLVLKVTDSVCNPSLIKSILSIVNKLEAMSKGKITQAIKEKGFSLVCKLSLSAQKWGNKSASTWISDIDFTRYLAIMIFNGQFC